MYMTKDQYDKLELKRDYISFFGFALIMLNLLIGLATLVGSIITGVSLVCHPISLTVVLIIAVLTGLFALLNMQICRKLKATKIK
jgi:hypothetical protein